MCVMLNQNIHRRAAAVLSSTASDAGVDLFCSAQS